MSGLSYSADVCLTSTLDAGIGSAPRASGVSDDIFDALNPRGRRRQASPTSTRPEDLLMNAGRRDRMDANALDVHRNMSLLGWMIRRTLDYCCLWDFHPMTQDEGLNRDLRTLMARDCEPENLDYLGRQSWDDHRRISEALKINTGDCFTVPLNEGTLQLVEGSFCRNPRDLASGSWLNGAKLNKRGRVVQWNFRETDMSATYGNQYTDRQVSARNVWQHVQYERRANAVRGISPIISALNELRDIDETKNLALAKVKVEQMFGLAMFLEPDADDDIPKVNEDGSAPDEDSETNEELYDFGNGPVVIRRKKGEDVKILTSNNPGGNTIEFMRLCIQLCLLGLDLPANFYNPSETNFFGSRAAWNLYERSCHSRRQSQLRLHKRMTRWRLWQWILPVELGGTGEIALPRSMSIDDLLYSWIPRGVPWWKPQEELATGLASVAAGLNTMQGLCDQSGLGIFQDNLRQTARDIAFAKSLGFDLIFNPARLDVTLKSQSTTPPAKGSAA